MGTYWRGAARTHRKQCQPRDFLRIDPIPLAGHLFTGSAGPFSGTSTRRDRPGVFLRLRLMPVSHWVGQEAARAFGHQAAGNFTKLPAREAWEV